ncbi:hypothetical protein G7B40_007290 [Aetokthonos hydrillicola Thurmond2011]|jgi:hypothetical protein|uniref:Uncharacterized protein n=1 Tax=Aetokthonos hydrillicola Thurmond2011 TaxID=2712845 RepID=A0AAP5I8E3_9CYAN|nr:hypothetical protein [Aetokthonos hydrillicola]MBO3459301.1 hypothetical protein [Aetokthonos hydrillicola CCALA 1050]MBW4587727.1 hypothetical protein [Aetokthonos hydrillicola CCALA 1050]MDR9894375.1 hypothetical protein [Aetokthonos hydrillicola Thurmond2011]
MFEYCGNTINQKKLGNKDLKNLFQKLEDLIDEGKDIDDDTTQQILNYALDWTQGKELWEQLRVRFQESFPELVVLPALNHFFKCYDDLVSKIDSANKTRIYNSEEIEEKRTELSENRRNLPQSIKDISHSFQKQINGYIEEFRKIKDIQEQQPILQKLDQDNISGFDTINNIFREIKDDLEISIIKPIQKALIFKKPDYVLREELTTDTQTGINITDRDVNDITKNYSLVLGMFSERNSAEVEEKRVRHLYESVSEAISERTNISLKLKSKKLNDAIEKLYNNQNSKLRVVINQVTCNELSLDTTITNDFNKDVAKNPLSLPQNFFNLKLKGEIEPHRKINFLQKLWQILTLKGDRNKDRNKKIANMIAEEWSKGINEKEKELWDRLSNWIKESLEEYSNRFENSTVKVIQLVERELNERISNFEQESANKQKIFEDINSKLKLAKRMREELEKKCHKPMRILPPEYIQTRL